MFKGKKLLSSYMDNELIGIQKELPKPPVKDCPRCSKVLEELKDLQNSFATMNGPMALQGYSTRVMAYIEESRTKRSFLLPVSTRTLEAVAIIAIIIIGTKAGNSPGSTYTQQKATIVSFLSLDCFKSVQANYIVGAYIAKTKRNNEK